MKNSKLGGRLVSIVLALVLAYVFGQDHLPSTVTPAPSATVGNADQAVAAAFAARRSDVVQLAHRIESFRRQLLGFQESATCGTRVFRNITLQIAIREDALRERREGDAADALLGQRGQ